MTVFAISAIAQTKTAHNAIIFVADGLRPSTINTTDTPTFYEKKQRGVNFVNSHSLFPTFTTANMSVIATGHYLGDTSDFSTTIDVGFPVAKALNLQISGNGRLVGRVLNESLIRGSNNVSFESETLQSQQGANGLRAILKYQTVWKTRYFDVAGFPDRTLGLD